MALTSATVLVALPAGAATAGCSVNYVMSSQWQGGFGANVSITNLGDPLTGWMLTWLYQGRDPGSDGTSYNLLPWRPAVLTLQR